MMDETLAARITGFVGTIRANGFPVGIGEVEDALRIAGSVGIMRREALFWGWRGLLCARAEEWRRFDDLFDSFWLPPNRRTLVETHASGGGRIELDMNDAAAGGKAGPAIQRSEGEVPGNAEASSAKEGASATEVLDEADFRSLIDRDQTRLIEASIRRFACRLQRLKIRRERTQARGRRLDLRQTLRRSIGAGGVPARLSFRVPRLIRARLVLLLDVSRSMSLYSFFYLRVARALAAELSDVHVYLYHTHLTHVSGALSDPDPWRAQERLRLLSAGWAGGTRIGECLAAFNRLHAGRIVHSRTAVIVASDGYDTGEAGILGRELAALARRARRIVWLNPLKATPGYAPLARGMREALPVVDLFAAGHNLASLDMALSSIMEVL
ncbi:MAG: VWA domain-containing protein [Beijerinckiaceae bacterium]|jgi:uncharacterized protein with von Willebrand factor type A (vWA) domain